MTRRTPSSTNKLRRGTQELLERRGMATSPGPLAPQLRTNAPPAGGGMSLGGDAFRHGGRDVGAAAMHSAPAMHAELKGHRHRGAEKHSAH
ncbi:hypothetical protein ACIGZJ_12235 [Kitasatospora sp. NPDC052868]|uniref:hypothetical protein n=1 Tax=Kitasatospora sp. NPDC052868 TaxID=3364060 RepID=UPI0037CBC044